MAKENKNLFTRRAFVTGALKLGLTSILVGRMYYLQIWQSDHYKILSNGNRIRLIYTTPNRALVLDRNSRPLALNQKSFRVVMYRDGLKEFQRNREKICQFAEIDSTQFAEIVMKSKKLPHSIPVTIKDNLDWASVSRIEVNAHNLVGLKVEEGTTRSYPWGSKAASFLGYVASPGQELAETNIAYRLPGVKVGKSGLEKSCDKNLFGQPGYSEVEVNSRGKIVRQLQDEKSQAGQDVKLTIDAILQEKFHNRLSLEKSVSAVLLKLEGNEVLSMVSTPSYDPNAFVNGVPHTTWKEWLESPYHPLLNKTIQGEYSPGSIFKTVVALAALENNFISGKDQIFCPGYYYVNDHKYHCWNKHGHGNVDVVTSMQMSCDVFYYEIARKVGIAKIAEMARKLGFGAETGIELSEERSGLVPEKEWKKRRFGRSWTIGDTVLAGIGQGYLLATPLQLAQLASILASDGVLNKPSLILGGPETSAKKKIGINPRSLALVQQGLFSAVNSPTGTARGTNLNIPGWTLVGKTSTTQVRRVTERQRKEGLKDSLWHLKDHAMFMGYAPYENPKYALALVIEHGGWSSKSAVPMAKDLMEIVYNYDQGQER